MGVPGLWKEIQQYGIDCALARLYEVVDSSSSSSHDTEDRHRRQGPLRLGIDVSSWLFHARQSSGGYNPLLRLLFYRLCRLLAVPNVQPVFVFDGPLRPKEKRGSVRREYREPGFVRDFKDLIIAFGFVVHDAIGEAEAELANLNRRGILDAVMSDDVDSFVFGARIVVRNWGQELPGSKARTEYVAVNSTSEDTPGSSGGEESTTKGRGLSAKDRHALGANLLLYFRASEIAVDGLSLGGFILVAILSGGDYDIQGLPRCGVKISIALAKAGFGDSLLRGVVEHCRPPPSPATQQTSNRLTAPETSGTWAPFLSGWLESVREELSTNKSGHLGRKFKKLSDSDSFTELLSTKASLCVLGSYVWPQTSQEDPSFTFEPIDLARISKMCQHFFRWTAPATLDTLRNNLWEGCAVKELAGDCVLGLVRSQGKEKQKKTSKGTGAEAGVSISQYFEAGGVRDIPSARSQGVAGMEPLIQSIAGDRESGATGYVKEVRAICNVKAYVELARGGLDYNLTAEDLRGPLPDVSASQTSTTSSPRKRKPFAEPSKELRLWIAEALVHESGVAQQALRAYQEKARSKGKPAQARETATGGQGRLEQFFLGSKSGSGVSAASLKATFQKGISNVSPTKRRVPLQTSSQSSLSPPSSSPSPSPTPQPAKKLPPTKTANTARARPTPKKMREGEEEEEKEKEKGRREVRLPDWNSDLLDDPEEEDANLSLDTSLPDIIFPAQRPMAREQAAISVDDSVEFVRVHHSPRKEKANLVKGPAEAIEVSDDSEED